MPKDQNTMSRAGWGRPGMWMAMGLILAATSLLLAPAFSLAEAVGQAELAKKVQNPVADLISVPLQNNWDFGIGPENATRYLFNVQPIVPFSLSEQLMLITRTIVPIIHAEAPVAGLNSKTGLGDILQSFFLVPVQDDPGSLGWGVGPVLLWPAATDDALGTGKWGAGPTAVAVLQKHGWTVGMLANHVWSYAGDNDRTYVNASLVQPFVSYLTKTYTTFGVTSETSYDWNASELTVPVNLTVSQMFRIGKLPFQVGLGPRIYVDQPSGGPDWGMRFTLTMLLPGI